MTTRTGASVRMRRLGRALAEHRQAAGLTQIYASQQLGWSEAKMVRLEGARSTRPSLKDIEAALELYGVRGDEREATLQLARKAKESGWWVAYRDVLLGLEAYVAFEDAAADIRAFNAAVVPGLLQTPQYAAAAFAEAGLPEAEERGLERRVAVRMTRSLILERPNPPRYQAVFTEGAIRQQVGGPAVMREQLDRIITVARRPNADIRLLPFSAGAHSGMNGPFDLFDYVDPADHPIAYLETVLADLYLDDDESIAAYRTRFERLQAQALDEAKTVKALTAMRDEIE